MALFAAELSEDTSIQVHRLDPEDVLGSAMARPFELDGQPWPTAEHYMQANQFTRLERIAYVRNAGDARRARRLARCWYWRPRRDWKRILPVYMTRAIYTQTHLYPDLYEALLATGEHNLLAMDQYDYFWGVGRDHRGLNWYGRVLSNVREKCRDEQKPIES